MKTSSTRSLKVVIPVVCRQRTAITPSSTLQLNVSVGVDCWGG